MLRWSCEYNPKNEAYEVIAEELRNGELRYVAVRYNSHKDSISFEQTLQQMQDAFNS